MKAKCLALRPFGQREAEERSSSTPQRTVCVYQTHTGRHTVGCCWLGLGCWEQSGAQCDQAEASVAGSRDCVVLQTCLGWINHAH